MKLVYSKKYGIIEITSKNYQSLVIDGDMEAWIVAVKGAGKISLDKWEDLEYNLRGLSVRVGMIDPSKDGAFLKQKGFLQNDKKYPAARVFPYGGYKIKAAEKRDVESLKEAEKAALDSLPDETTKIKNIQEIQHYVRKGYLAKPLKMPVILMTDKRVTSPLFRAIALKYSKYFNFGVMRKPSQELMQNFQVKKLPTILVMLATESPNKKVLKFSSVFYDTKLYGGISYLNLTKFFYAVHNKHWAEQPDARKYKGNVGLREFYVEDFKEILSKDGDTSAERESDNVENTASREVEITFQNHKRMCSDNSLGLCLIYFLDAKDEKAVKKALRLYKDLQKMSSIKDKSLHYLWVNASCHPQYGEIFGISSENLPVLLFAKPKQRLFKTLRDDLTKEHVSEIVSEIFLGREDLSPFSRFNDMMSVDCTKTETPEVKSKDEETIEDGKTMKKNRKSSRKTEEKQSASDEKKPQRTDEL